MIFIFFKIFITCSITSFTCAIDFVPVQTKFPDEFSELLTTAHTLLRTRGKQEEHISDGITRLIKALEINPSQAVVMELLSATERTREVGPIVAGVLKKYLEDFLTNKDEHAKQNGYRNKLIVGIYAGNYLGNINHKNPEQAKYYRNKALEFNEEQKTFQKTSRW